MTPEEQAKAELDANILAGGGLGLDPENDPVIATTDWGLDIKFHNVGEYQGAGYLLSNPSTNGSLSSGALSGYCYVTMGSYGGRTLNWVIIGYSTNGATGKGVVKATGLNIPDSTDAGNVLKSASSKGQLVSTKYLLNAYSNAVGTSEIPGGCVLTITEELLTVTMALDADTSWPIYEGSDVQSNLLTFYSSGFGFTSTQQSNIQPQTFRSYYYHDSSTTYCTSSNQFLFLLASNTDWPSSSYPQAFCVETYLKSDNKRVASRWYGNKLNASWWWLRTGVYSSTIHAVYIKSDGVIDSKGYLAMYSGGVRPAMILKL